MEQKKSIAYAAKKVGVKYAIARFIVMKYTDDGTISAQKTPHEKKREKEIQRNEVIENHEENQEGRNPQ